MYARVVILSVRGKLVRKFMLTAYRLGMTNGEWAFFDVELFQVSSQNKFTNIIVSMISIFLYISAILRENLFTCNFSDFL